MADSSTGSPHTNYLVSRWAPERGLVSADGFQWLEERLQEAHNSLVKPNKARLGSRNRSSGLNGFGNMANRGATLGFASVTNGLENPKVLTSSSSLIRLIFCLQFREACRFYVLGHMMNCTLENYIRVKLVPSCCVDLL